jgi:hypothetical protein
MSANDNDEKDTSSSLPLSVSVSVSVSKLAWYEQPLLELKALEKEVNEHPGKQVS